ncbi:11939_t:CDS:2, partial [Racocetra fulgida]
LNFSGKAVLHAQGVDFSNGNSYKINMDELQVMEEIGKGQYGTVQKEIRLELDEAKLNQILMELDILHKAKSDYIVDFYGAFFIESCVYYCMEYMDAGSLDKLYGDGVPEDVLAKITTSTYTVQSDVWSLGLAMVELGTGKYPYPVPDKNEQISMFVQLNAIVTGTPPSLPEDKFSEELKYEEIEVNMKAWAEEAFSLSRNGNNGNNGNGP